MRASYLLLSLSLLLSLPASARADHGPPPPSDFRIIAGLRVAHDYWQYREPVHIALAVPPGAAPDQVAWGQDGRIWLRPEWYFTAPPPPKVCSVLVHEYRHATALGTDADHSDDPNNVMHPSAPPWSVPACMPAAELAHGWRAATATLPAWPRTQRHSSSTPWRRSATWRRWPPD